MRRWRRRSGFVSRRLVGSPKVAIFFWLPLFFVLLVLVLVLVQQPQSAAIHFLVGSASCWPRSETLGPPTEGNKQTREIVAPVSVSVPKIKSEIALFPIAIRSCVIISRAVVGFHTQCLHVNE